MKILFIHNYYQSKNIGGEDIVFRNEVNEVEKIIGSENVITYTASNNDIKKSSLLFSIWFSVKHYKNIKKLIINNAINIVHIHNFFPLLSPSIIWAATRSNTKVILTLHNYRLWCISGIFYRNDIGICEKCINKRLPFSSIKHKCYRQSLPQSILAQLSYSFYKFTQVFDKIDYFFVLTEFQKEKVINLGLPSKKIILKPNGIQESLTEMSTKNNCYIYVGRLEESKGIYTLLDTWKSLSLEYKLIIIGTGEDEGNLRKTYAKENIFFLGKCDRKTTLGHISKAKYLLQPSLWYETFGLTIIEAFANGTPVIGFNIGTRPEFIKHEVNGFICTIETLKSTIEYSYNFKGYATLVKNAKADSQKYNITNIAKQQIAIYQDILKKS